jgi:hypothetical protein
MGATARSAALPSSVSRLTQAHRTSKLIAIRGRDVLGWFTPGILADAELAMLRDFRRDPHRGRSIHGPIIVPRGAEARLW